MNINELERLESELAERIEKDQKNWIRIYTLIHQVEVEQLWQARPETKSFTAWMNSFAKRLDCHVSLLWARRSAGLYYTEFYERQVSAGRSVPALETVSRLSPETINLCATVAGKNADKMDSLLESALAGNLSRADLRSASRAAKAARKEAGEAQPVNGYSAIRASDRGKGKPADLTEADIILALRQDHSWVGQHNSAPYISRKYCILDQFRANAGSSHHARRMDVLAIETLTVSERDTLRLHGIEIKVSVSDLKGDHKMAEYCPFVDYFYLAVPDTQGMLTAADDVRLPDWGVLAVEKSGTMRVIHSAALNPGTFRDKTMAAALIKLL